MSNNNLKKMSEGIIKENPVFTLYLGLCSSLAVSSSLDNAIGMGIGVLLVLILSNTVISLIRKIVPDEIRIPVYIVIIATLVTTLDLLMQAYAPGLSKSLGVFVQLIAVNCIILGRAESFASKNTVGASILDAIGMGLGFTFALVCVGSVRELLGTAQLALSNPFTGSNIFTIGFSQAFADKYALTFMNGTTGAFITFACFAALFSYINDRNMKKKVNQ